MSRITIGFGIALIVLGIGAYGWAMIGESASVTALIPAFVGLPIAVLGFLSASQPERRKLYMHIAVALAVIGLLGAARGLPALPKMFTDYESVERPAAVIVQSAMALLCLVYTVLALRSFIAARSGAAETGN